MWEVTSILESSETETCNVYYGIGFKKKKRVYI